MLALYTDKGVAPEVNLWEHISHTPPQSLNKAAPSKTGVSVDPQIQKKKYEYVFLQLKILVLLCHWPKLL